jgi:N-acetylneuraminic acid mutarotase
MYSEAKDSTFVSDYEDLLDATGDDDNGDRLVVLEWFNKSDADYLGGNIKIIKKEFSAVSNAGDGSEIYNQAVVAGENEFTYREDFITGSKYNFKIFTESSSGVLSTTEDSQNVEVSIPEVSAQVYQRLNTTAPDQPAAATLFEGDRKTYITWSTSIVPDNANQILIYSDTNSFPTVDEDGSITGTLVYQSLPSEGRFFHYNLDNNIKRYYSLVFTDHVGNPSGSTHLSGTPNDIENDEENIPVNDVENVRYDVQEGSAVIFWGRFLENKSVSVGLTENIVFFARIKDEFGTVIENEDIDVDFEVSATSNTYNGAVEDVFRNESEVGDYTLADAGRINVVDDPSGLYRIALDKLRDGRYKGIITRNNVDAFKNIQSLNIDLKLKVTLPNLTFTTSSLNISWENQLDFSIDNYTSSMAEILCNKRLTALAEQITQETRKFDGGYARANENLVLRVPYEFNRSAGTEVVGISAAIYSAVGDPCSDSDLSVGKRLGVSGGPKTRFLPVDDSIDGKFASNSGFPLNIEIIDEIDDDNLVTGGTSKISFATIELAPPSVAENVWLYIKVDYLGFSAVKRKLLVFKSPLVVEIKPRIPLFDGKDIAEQKASVFLVDPDDPDNSAKFTLIDGPKLKWELVKKLGTTSERPFYSNDTDGGGSFFAQKLPSLGNNTKTTVYSNIEEGVADNVFFGPIYDTTATAVDSDGSPKFDEYDLVASVSYDGLLSTDSVGVELDPFIDQVANQSVETSNFLMEFDDMKQEVYSDGIDFARLNISHDPENNYSKFASCFTSCMATSGKTIYALSSNNSVKITSSDPDVEFIWGDVREVLEPYGSRITLDTTRAKTGKGSVSVGLSNGSFTTVYVRYKKFLPDQHITGFEDDGNVNCSCLNVEDQQTYEQEITINAFMTTLIGNKVLSMTGGGAINVGIPPTVLVPVEPLELTIVKKRAATDTTGLFEETVYGLTIDGVTQNRLTYNLKFAGLPVPNGTKISFDTLNTFSDLVTAVDLSDDTVTSVDSEVDPSSARSYANGILNAMQPGKPFEGFFLASANYDESGDVSRPLTSCIRISSTGLSGDDFLSLFSQRLLRYHTSSTTWFELSDMIIPRALHVLEEVSSKLYAIGGVNSTGIMDSVEEYDIATDTWTELTRMPTPRMGAQSAVFSGEIYVMGGVEFDRSTDRLVVSTVVEKYDPVADSWESLDDMPLIDAGFSDLTSYGVAFGHAHQISVSGDERIYVLSGMRKVAEDGSAYKLNDRVLFYDIVSNTWTASDELDSDEMVTYGRVSPNAFIKSGTIFVFGGTSNDSDDNLELLTNGYKYVFSTASLTDAHDEFDEIPEPRLYAAYALDSTNSDFYVMGGWNKKSQFTKQFESFDISGSIIARSDLAASTFTGAISGASSLVTTIVAAPYSSVENVFLSGGFASTKGNNFLQIITDQVDTRFEINNNETQGLRITFKDEEGEEFTTSIDTIVNGYVQSLGVPEIQDAVIQDKFTKYPIRYVDNTLTLASGVGVLELLSRSDDFLRLVEEKQTLSEGSELDKYKIVNEIVINDGTYNGRTFVNTVPVLSPVPSSLDEDNCFSGFSCLSIASLNPSLQGKMNKFNVLVADLEQKKAPVYTTFISGPVLGEVTRITTDPLDAPDTLVALMDILETPFGPSPFYDALKDISEYLSEDSFDSDQKTIYVVTDDEESGSVTSLDQAIEDVNAIDGEKEVPVIIGNLNLASEV